MRGGLGPPPVPALKLPAVLASFRVGQKDPQPTDAPTPALSSNLAARGGWPHRCGNPPPSHGERRHGLCLW